MLGTLVLAPKTLETVWLAAEFLLHEAMHVKYLDLLHTHSLLRKGYRDSESPIINPPWHRPDPNGSRDWPVERCMTVLHVYATLSVFFLAIERDADKLEPEFGPLGELNPEDSARRALDRAHFLTHVMQQERQQAELGLAGRRLVAWLSELINGIDPSPRPHNTETHLLLELYEREAAELERALASSTAASTAANVEALVRDIVHRDVKTINEILSVLDKERISGSPANASSLESWRIRLFAIQSLRSNPVEALGTTGERLVREMVRGSEQGVGALRAELEI
ncbi:MAG: hypothetical protein M3319_03205 [Actinomycetota bacterium]|nr:hypothetical protein [Actinomycetota bacterium]